MKSVLSVFHKRLLRCCFLILISQGFCFSGSAQNFGGVSPHKDWRIKSIPKLNIVYEAELDSLADHILRTTLQMERYPIFSLGDKRDRIHLTLRNENLIANGFVSYSPFSSEFYLTPAQDPNSIGFGDWLETLSHHEYRHVYQFSNIRQGLVRWIRPVLGDMAQGAIHSLLVPNWFLEGDAVFYETVSSTNGRGRLPAFTAEIRAFLQENKRYSYAKFRNGSLKDFVPNHYVHGYLLTGYGYSEYSEHFWKDIFRETSGLKGVFVPFAKSICRNTGYEMKEFHQKALDFYEERLPDPGSFFQDTENAFFPGTDDYINEIQLLLHSAGRTFVLESGYNEITSVYEWEEGKKKRLFALGKNSDVYVNISDSRISFINNHTDPRWINREYGDIRYYDFEKEKVIRVTRKRRFLSADFQESTQKYIGVEMGADGVSYLMIFDEKTAGYDTLPGDRNTYYAYPRWLGEESTRFLVTGRKEGKMHLAIYDPESREIDTLITPIAASISRPQVSGDNIYFSSGADGTDNIYRINYRTGKREQITHVYTGAYNPTLRQDSADTLYYSLMTAAGQRIFKINTNTGQDPVPEIRSPFSSLLPTDIFSKSFPREPAEEAYTEFPEAKEYSPLKNLLHFHSLLLEPGNGNPSLSFLSNDYLNTTSAALFTRYSNQDDSFEAGAKINYARLYPVISLEVLQRMNKKEYFRADDELISIPKTETEMNISLQLPWNLSSRQYHQNLVLQTTYGWVREHFDPNHPALPGKAEEEPRLYQNGTAVTGWELTRRLAYRDLLPKWGITATLGWLKNFAPKRYQYTTLYATQSYYLPGFFKNDGFKFKWQWQRDLKKADNTYRTLLSSAQSLPVEFPGFKSGSLLTANYIFPLAYPEINISHLVYTKRLALNLFTEHFQSDVNAATWSGIDLFLTARYFNMADGTAGIRTYIKWPITDRRFQWNLIFLKDL